MATTEAVKQIATHLNLLFRDDARWTYDAAARASGVPRETIRRVMEGKIRRLIGRNATKLANFIEKQTQGRVSATYLLKTPGKNFYAAKIPGVDFSGEDLREADFTRAYMPGAKLAGANIDAAKFDLADLREADLTGVVGNASFRSANLSGSKIADTRIEWDMTGVAARNITLKDLSVEEHTRLSGADFSGKESRFVNVAWRAVGARTLGTKIPEDLDPNEIHDAFCDHLMLARACEVEFDIDIDNDEGDIEVLHFCEFMLTRKASLLRCYDGGAKRLMTHHLNLVDDVMEAWGKYDWYAKERLQLALHVYEHCHTLEDFLMLRDSPFYSPDFMPGEGSRSSRSIINKYIRRARTGEFVSGAFTPMTNKPESPPAIAEFSDTFSSND